MNRERKGGGREKGEKGWREEVESEGRERRGGERK